VGLVKTKVNQMTYEPIYSAQAQSVRVMEKYLLDLLVTIVVTLQVRIMVVRIYSLPFPLVFYKSMYLEVIAVLHCNKHDDVIHACVSKACVSSK